MISISDNEKKEITYKTILVIIFFYLIIILLFFINIKSGNSFGQDSFFINSNKREILVKTIEVSTLLYLSYENFISLIGDYKEDYV